MHDLLQIGIAVIGGAAYTLIGVRVGIVAYRQQNRAMNDATIPLGVFVGAFWPFAMLLVGITVMLLDSMVGFARKGAR